MIEFVVDEGINDKRMVTNCNSEAKCCVHRYPERLKGKKDYEMLPEVLSGPCSLVTIDGVIVEENITHIPQENSGVVVIRLRRPSRPMTAKIAAKLLSNFKSRFPLWAETNWRGLQVEILENEVVLSPLLPTRSKKSVVSYDSDNFEARMRAAIESIHVDRGRLVGGPLST